MKYIKNNNNYTEIIKQLIFQIKKKNPNIYDLKKKNEYLFV